ncbi:MAG: pilus assembly protein N-terminal domain-containing protein [Pseudolabrys sp.]
MWDAFGRHKRILKRWAWTILFAATLGTSAQADTVTINLDQARIMKLPDRVATIVIGNPLIADATLQSGGMLVVTGKGYGATNMVALDRNGRVVMDKTVQVLGPGGGDLVVVYKGIERESYSCAPECERRVTLGDSAPYFSGNLTQTGTRSEKAQSATPAK